MTWHDTGQGLSGKVKHYQGLLLVHGNKRRSCLKRKDDMNVVQKPNPSTVISIDSSKYGDL